AEVDADAAHGDAIPGGSDFELRKHRVRESAAAAVYNTGRSGDRDAGDGVRVAYDVAVGIGHGPAVDPVPTGGSNSDARIAGYGLAARKNQSGEQVEARALDSLIADELGKLGQPDREQDDQYHRGHEQLYHREAP